MVYGGFHRPPSLCSLTKWPLGAIGRTKTLKSDVFFQDVVFIARYLDNCVAIWSKGKVANSKAIAVLLRSIPRLPSPVARINKPIQTSKCYYPAHLLGTMAEWKIKTFQIHSNFISSHMKFFMFLVSVFFGEFAILGSYTKLIEIFTCHFRILSSRYDPTIFIYEFRGAIEFSALRPVARGENCQKLHFIATGNGGNCAILIFCK